MLGRKIAYNSVISAGARIIGLALSLIIIGLLTRYLGQDGFGYYSTVLAFLFFFYCCYSDYSQRSAFIVVCFFVRQTRFF